MFWFNWRKCGADPYSLTCIVIQQIMRVTRRILLPLLLKEFGCFEGILQRAKFVLLLIYWFSLTQFCMAACSKLNLYKKATLDNHYYALKLHLCLVLLQVPKCFVPVQIFWASPKTWLHLVPPQKLLCWHKKTILLNAKHLFVWHKMFVTATICK